MALSSHPGRGPEWAGGTGRPDPLPVGERGCFEFFPEGERGFPGVAAKCKLCFPLSVGDQGRPYAVALPLRFPRSSPSWERGYA